MKTLNEIIEDIKLAKFTFYVYILYKPDQTPFYVGKGKAIKGKYRISWHEYESKLEKPLKSKIFFNALKVNTIKKIWRQGGIVYYSIDSWHMNETDSLEREKEIIACFGRQIEGSGTLTNILESGESDLRPESTKKKISDSLKKYFSHPENRKSCGEAVKKAYAGNPELIKRARKNAIKNESHKHIMDWIKNNPELKSEVSSKNMRNWYANNPESAKELASRRNAVLKTDEHRLKMSIATLKFNQENPEIYKLHRDKINQAQKDLFDLRVRCVCILRDFLIKTNKLNKDVWEDKKPTSHNFYAWKQRGIVPIDIIEKFKIGKSKDNYLDLEIYLKNNYSN